MKDGKDCKLREDVERVLKEFHRSRKPIGYVCFDPSSHVKHDAKQQAASAIYLIS